MGYVDEILEPDEKVVFKTRLSWTLYGPAIVYALIALALPIAASTEPTLPSGVSFAVFIFAALETPEGSVGSVEAAIGRASAIKA